SNAMLQLGLIYRNGNDLIKKDDLKASKWFEQGAKKGNPSAIHNLGVSYYKGLGITEDKAKAFKYFSQSAELGLLQSQVIVA
ncbi:sel1 repeat family protein, partial [Acinetobacter baumannii]